MAFRLAVASDTHLNYVSSGEATELGTSASKLHGADALLLCGDISEATTVEQALIDVDAGFHRPIFAVLGNHDYYGGSFAGVHAKLAVLSKRHPRITWLRTAGVVALTPTTALVGIDGLTDCVHGQPLAGAARMNDGKYIADLRGLEMMRKVEVMFSRAKVDVAALERNLTKALRKFNEVIVATHVPPFPEMASEKPVDVQSWYVARLMGEMLIKVAAKFPTKRIRVRCGHVHRSIAINPAPNLSVTAGLAEYRYPAIHTTLELQ